MLQKYKVITARSDARLLRDKHMEKFRHYYSAQSLCVQVGTHRFGVRMKKLASDIYSRNQ